jgi:hypothetical protein
MHLARRISRPLRDEPAPGELLGDTHPLVRTLGQLEVLRTQTVVLSALLASSVVALLDGVAGAVTFVVAAAFVLLVLACRAAILTDRMHERALDVVIGGGGDVPIEAVRRQRARLLEPRHRRRLAASLDEMCHEALQPIAPWARVRPIFDVRVVAEAAPALSTVARQLRSDNARLRGIAMAQRLIVDGTSPLYGDDGELLRQELRRIHYHLVDRS